MGEGAQAWGVQIAVWLSSLLAGHAESQFGWAKSAIGPTWEICSRLLDRGVLVRPFQFASRRFADAPWNGSPAQTWRVMDDAGICFLDVDHCLVMDDAGGIPLWPQQRISQINSGTAGVLPDVQLSAHDWDEEVRRFYTRRKGAAGMGCLCLSPAMHEYALEARPRCREALFRVAQRVPGLKLG